MCETGNYIRSHCWWGFATLELHSRSEQVAVPHTSVVVVKYIGGVSLLQTKQKGQNKPHGLCMQMHFLLGISKQSKQKCKQKRLFVVVCMLSRAQNNPKTEQCISLQAGLLVFLVCPVCFVQKKETPITFALPDAKLFIYFLGQHFCSHVRLIMHTSVDEFLVLFTAKFLMSNPLFVMNCPCLFKFCT